MRRTLTIVFLLACLVATLVYAVGSWHLLDKFSTADASPLADPITTSGGQSVDVVDGESKMSVSSGYLNVPAQASVVNGDEGLRYTTSATQFAGRTIFFKVVYSTLANSTVPGSEEGSNSAAFGWTTSANCNLGGTTLHYAVRSTAANFLWPIAEFCSGACTPTTGMPMVPTTTDSFYIAVALGGRDGGDDESSIPWYSGVNASGYTDGAFLWIKKNVGGKWFLQACGNDAAQANAYALITNTNSAFKVDRWGASNDTLRSLMQPVHYSSFTAADNTQLFDIPPEVGTAWDSVGGNFIVTTNRIHATGSDPDGAGALNWRSTFNTDDDDIYMEALPDVTGATDVCHLIVRYDTNDGSFMMAGISRTVALLRIYTCDGSSFTLRATATAYTLKAGINLLAVSVRDSTITTWSQGTLVLRGVSYTGTTALTNIGSNRHGVRLDDTATELDELRVYPYGNDDEYRLLDVYFSDRVNRNNVIKVR